MARDSLGRLLLARGAGLVDSCHAFNYRILLLKIHAILFGVLAETKRTG